MAYKYKYFIPQNTAPHGTKSIGVYKNGTKIYDIPLGRLTPVTKSKLYSFGLLSDVHLAGNGSYKATRFDNALTFFENQGASFCCISGDITDTGFWYPISETDGTSYYDTKQFDEYRSICQKHGIPVYTSCGNHESYNGYDVSKTYADVYGENPSLVVNTLEKLEEYTGDGLVFTKTYGNDVFIFVGQSTQTLPMTVEHLQWLYERLEENRNKRCFVFIHSYVSKDDSGNPLGLHSLPLFGYWGATNTKAFVDMMKHYKNVIVFHGHSHVHFSTQEQASHSIYSEELGFRSVHIPSSANGRKVINGALGSKDTQYSLGYIADVYNNSIVLNGIDLITNRYVPIGVYKINTTLVEIPEKSFVDSTGIIKTK